MSKSSHKTTHELFLLLAMGNEVLVCDLEPSDGLASGPTTFTFFLIEHLLLCLSDFVDGLTAQLGLAWNSASTSQVLESQACTTVPGDSLALPLWPSYYVGDLPLHPC